MSRIEVNGIYKHAPLTNAQMATTKRNLDREVVIMRDAVTDRATLIPTVTDPTTDASAYPTSYIYAMDYDSTDDSGDNPNIRRHIPTLELLGDVGDNTAGSNWINIQTNAIGTYNYLSGGETLQEAIELLDGQVSSNTLKYIIDGSTVGSLNSSTDGATPAGITNVTGDYQIALGYGHTLSASAYSSILGGYINYIDQSSGYSSIAGGHNAYITVSSTYGFIGGGEDNGIISSSVHTSIVGGFGQNIVSADHSIIGGGYWNRLNNLDASGIFAGGKNYIDQSARCVIGGGYNNQISTSDNSFIGAGNGNYIGTGVTHVFIGGGDSNTIIQSGSYSSIVGGLSNTIDALAEYSFIGGGESNTIHGSGTANHAVIGGGKTNTITGGADYAFIGGGELNVITDGCDYGVIGGGYSNYLNSGLSYSVIAGGNNNEITDGSSGSFIGAGQNNTIMDASTYSAILGGSGNTLAEGCTESFIIGTGIDTTGIHRTDTTFMNNMFLWDRGLELKDRTGNPGDVLIIESVDGTSGMPYVTWGSGSAELSTCVGLSRTNGESVSTCTLGGTSGFNMNYVTVITSTSARQMMVPLTYDFPIYEYADGNPDYSNIWTDYNNELISGNTFYIDPDYDYHIEFKSAKLKWMGQYANDDVNEFTIDLSTIYADIQTRSSEHPLLTTPSDELVGNRSFVVVNTDTSDYAGGRVDNVNRFWDITVDHDPFEAGDTTHQCDMYFQYNVTTGNLLMGFKSLYYNTSFIKQPYSDNGANFSMSIITSGTGSGDPDNKMVIYGWPTWYPRPTVVGETVYVWTSDPSGISPMHNTTYLQDSTVIPDGVMLNATYTGATLTDVAIQLPDLVPYVHASIEMKITKILSLRP